MTYLDAIDQLKNPQLSPGELSELKGWMAGEYAFLAGQLGQLLGEKPEKWATLREKATSDSQADKAWEATPEGKYELSARYKMKGLEKMMSAVNTRLRIMEGEMKNQY